MGPFVTLLKEGADAMSLGTTRTRTTTARTAPMMTFLFSSRSYMALRARRCGSRSLRGGRRPFRGALAGDEALSRDADERGVVARLVLVTSEPRTGFNDEATPDCPVAVPSDCPIVGAKRSETGEAPVEAARSAGCSSVLCVVGWLPGAGAESVSGGAQREKSLLTPCFYHTPLGSLTRSCAPASSHACDEERAPSQATPPLR